MKKNFKDFLCIKINKIGIMKTKNSYLVCVFRWFDVDVSVYIPMLPVTVLQVSIVVS